MKTLLREISDYHGKELTPAAIEVWKQDLGAYSEPHVRAAWVQHRRNSNFFPGVNELLKFLAPIAVDLGGFKPSKEQAECAVCGGTGFKSVKRPVDKNPIVTRCECRRKE